MIHRCYCTHWLRDQKGREAGPTKEDGTPGRARPEGEAPKYDQTLYQSGDT